MADNSEESFLPLGLGQRSFAVKKNPTLLTQPASRSGRDDVFSTTAFDNPLLSFRRNLNS